jgi:hypothetical protein
MWKVWGFSSFSFFFFNLTCRTACGERGCISNPDEVAAKSPAEAAAEALKLAFESLSVEDKHFCVDAPILSLSSQQV